MSLLYARVEQAIPRRRINHGLASLPHASLLQRVVNIDAVNCLHTDKINDHWKCAGDLRSQTPSRDAQDADTGQLRHYIRAVQWFCARKCNIAQSSVTPA